MCDGYKSRLKFLIGGSASSGSSLLAHYLNNHSKIYCGPETNLFTNPNLIESWQNSKKIILENERNPKPNSSNWHVHRGFQLSHLAADSLIRQLIEESPDFITFQEKLFSNQTDFEKKEFYAEKTPSNSVAFHRLHPLFVDTIFVLTVRNPYDAIASMTRRGWSIPYSAGLYLFNLSLGHIDSDRLMIVRYEDLIADAGKVLGKLLSPGNLEYEGKGMENLENFETLPSWLNSSKDMSLHKKPNNLRPKINRQIQNFISSLHFKNDFEIEGHTPKFQNIVEIVKAFGYNKEIGAKIYQ